MDDAASGSYTFDIDDQSSGNYEYWNNGALLADAHDEIDTIYWTVDRKVKKIVRDLTTGTDLPEMEFEYDAFGNRILKIEKPVTNGIRHTQQDWVYTYYMRDAAGNVMAIYELDYDAYDDRTYSLEEQNIYGAGRLGINSDDKTLAFYDESMSALTLYDFDDTSRTLGKKVYEFSGHTGNVNLTTTDRTIALNDGAGEIYGYVPDIVSVVDYYPFGLQKSGRNDNIDAYRYGFQGMETDKEKTGNHGGSYTTMFRQYDPRVGRWLSLDPLMAKFPHMSPYAAFDNNPIFYTDPYGLEPTNGEGDPPKEGDTREVDGYEQEFIGGQWVTVLNDVEVTAESDVSPIIAPLQPSQRYMHAAIMQGKYPFTGWQAEEFRKLKETSPELFHIALDVYIGRVERYRKQFEKNGMSTDGARKRLSEISMGPMALLDSRDMALQFVDGWHGKGAYIKVHVDDEVVLEFARAVQVVGTTVKYIGYAGVIFFGAGAPLIGIGTSMEKSGEVLEMSVHASNRDFDEAAEVAAFSFLPGKTYKGMRRIIRSGNIYKKGSQELKNADKAAEAINEMYWDSGKEIYDKAKQE